VKVACELLTLFRQKAGSGRLELEVPEEAPTVLAALRAAEARLGGQALLDGENPREGVLVFLKDVQGGTRRVLRPAEETIRSGQAVVLSTAMGGG
jgi:molybdopterin converting factor small subunit